MKKIGHVAGIITETGLEAYGLALLTRFGGWSEKDAKLLCEEGVKEIRSRKVHAYMPHIQVVGRKPE